MTSRSIKPYLAGGLTSVEPHFTLLEAFQVLMIENITFFLCVLLVVPEQFSRPLTQSNITSSDHTIWCFLVHIGISITGLRNLNADCVCLACL